MGIGIDLVEVKKIATMVKESGDIFLNSVFTPREISYCLKKKNFSKYLAARFAIKEATLKALGIGKAPQVNWKEIEVKHNKQGKPYLEFHGQTSEFIKNQGLTKFEISISHVKELAIGSVSIN